MPEDKLWGEVSEALMQLAIHTGMMNMAMQSPQYAPAAEGWRSWMRETRDWAHRKTEEVHDFGEAFD